jgi:hypothetical protein
MNVPKINNAHTIQDNVGLTMTVCIGSPYPPFFYVVAGTTLPPFLTSLLDKHGEYSTKNRMW